MHRVSVHGDVVSDPGIAYQPSSMLFAPKAIYFPASYYDDTSEAISALNLD
jgi:hypothetical protein